MKKMIVGVDMGGTNTVLGLIDRQGTIHARDNFSTCEPKSFDEYLKRLKKAIDKLISDYGEPIEIDGIGMGAPSANYYRGTIENAGNLPWDGDKVIPVREKMAKLMPNVPFAITNDANAAAFGEMYFGGAKGMDDFCIVTIGTGLGSGFVANGKLIYGHDGFAGELGHNNIEDEGRLCSCKNKGCVEEYVASRGVLRTFMELLEENPEEKTKLRGLTKEQLSTKIIAEAAYEGDKLAIECYDRTARSLGRALANAVAITSPKAIFLFGGVARAGDILLKPAKKYMEYYMYPNFRNKVELIPSALDEADVALLGAAALFLHEDKM